ncbi:hypothetical protein LCGC14_1715770 [marine sediment metagenome]|uniref:Uncharacterized protein n=1 Tax=marine sediment metagenome TaxID=412755 RepID=A0A0F9I1G7_9ZZZZ
MDFTKTDDPNPDIIEWRIKSRLILPRFSLWQRIRFLFGLRATSKEE